MKDYKISNICELKRNLNIDESIWDAYYNLTPQPTTDEEISKSYVGRLNWYNDPFPYDVYGAYPLKHDYELLQVKIEDDFFSKLGISRKDVTRYLKEYSKGFKIGYDNFEEDIVKVKSSLFDEKTDFSRTVFDFATGSIFKRSGYPEKYGGDYHILSGWYESGKESGYFYRAWYIMLTNSDRFLTYFKKIKENAEDSFVNHIIRGIYSLQKLDEKAICIKHLRDERKNEHEFRDWFIPWFEAVYNYVNSEPEKGAGRIDLKIEDNIIGTKIIEFKGWWNSDKNNVIEQLTNYMTEFDNKGYVFMINHLSKGSRGDIIEKYQEMIASDDLNYISWEELHYKDTAFKYFKSIHDFYGNKKEIYHFIYRLNK